MRVRAKICGITRAADAAAAVAAGADALGFNFYRASPRYIAPDQARAIIAALPPFVVAVGLFVDEDSVVLRETAAASGVQLLQFHGGETDSDCAAAGVRFIKALRVSGPVDGTALQRQYPHAEAFLLDGPASGRTFDWSWWPAACDRPLILAGGLRPENVARAIACTHPYAVDVSSGVEGTSKGAKDAEKMKRFIDEVQRAG